MSQSVREELEKATGIAAKRNEAHDDYVQRLCDKVSELEDAVWAKVSKPAQDFFNDFCDATNDNKPFPQFPEAASAAPVARGRGKTAAVPEAATPVAGIPQAGDQVIVTTKRNKVYEGEFLELDGDTAVVLVGSEEMEFTADRVLSIVLKNLPEAEEDTEVDATPKVGENVTLTTKRNAVVTGTVIEITDDVIVLEWDGKEQEYQRDRVASIVVNTSAQPEGDEDAAALPQVGDKVLAMTKRNKEVEGEVVEIDGNILVVKVAGGEEIDVDTTTAKSVKIISGIRGSLASAGTGWAGSGKEENKAPAARGRGAAKAEAAAAPTGRRGAAPAAPEAGKKSKVTNADNGGVSVTTRMREILCADPEMTSKELAAQLDSEKLTYKEATMMIVHKDVNKVIELLKKNKHFKA